METMNINKIPAPAAKTVGPYVEELVKIYGNALVSVFAYGSVTGEDYSPKTSDINLGIILDSLSIDKLKKSLPLVKKGLRKKVTTPLFLDASYIEMSLDTFPIEFIEIKDTRCILYGEDVLSTVVVNSSDIRHECESQLKGKLLTMRQAYLEQALTRKGLEELVKNAFRSLMPVFRNMLRIKIDRTPEIAREKMLTHFGEAFGMDISPLLEILRDKKSDGRIGSKNAEEFIEEFIEIINKLSIEIDKI